VERDRLFSLTYHESWGYFEVMKPSREGVIGELRMYRNSYHHSENDRKQMTESIG
jgi:hypothetical protein